MWDIEKYTRSRGFRPRPWIEGPGLGLEGPGLGLEGSGLGLGLEGPGLNLEGPGLGLGLSGLVNIPAIHVSWPRLSHFSSMLDIALCMFGNFVFRATNMSLGGYVRSWVGHPGWRSPPDGTDQHWKLWCLSCCLWVTITTLLLWIINKYQIIAIAPIIFYFLLTLTNGRGCFSVFQLNISARVVFLESWINITIHMEQIRWHFVRRAALLVRGDACAAIKNCITGAVEPSDVSLKVIHYYYFQANSI